MSRFEIIFTAVMATIIIHLTVAVIFVSVKISALKREIVAEIILSIDEEMPDEDMEKALELAKSDQLQGISPEEMVNINKNIADKPLDLDPKEYEEMVREEMVRSGLLNERNLIDQQKMAEEAGIEDIIATPEEVKPQVTEKKEKPQEKGTFRGPTRIFYDLAGRHHVYLPIPSYKCEGAGQVMLAIVVDRSGNVLRAELASKLSTTRDQCLTETAVEHALKTKFNADQSAPEKQGGYLTFVFVSQN